MSLLDKEPIKRVEEALKGFDNSLSVVVLDKPAHTAKVAASLLKCEVGAIVKSLLFKTEDSFILALVAGDKRCSLKKLKKITNKKDVSMANPEEVKTQTGYTIGGVSPVGHLKLVEILIDTSLKRFKSLYAAAGHPNCIFEINFFDLKKITNGELKEIIE
jgi:Cys-tRNA(Pro) deacylase